MIRVTYMLVLALAMAVVPQVKASQCIHFTNFCDTIVINQSGVLLYGNWDWLCNSNWTDTQVAGRLSGGHAAIAGRPYSAMYSYLSPYTALFDFKVNTKLFDLYETDGTTLPSLQSSQPWTVTSGVCRADDVRHEKPSSLQVRQ